MLSPDGHCRAFDAQAQGTVPGSGIGVVVLKRLEDALADGDSIQAIIRGSAINNDGSGKIGYTAPSINGQAEVITEALALAEVEPETISYIETHGTGTALGDPIEIAALNQVFRSDIDQKEYCALGSVKTNIGHLDAAAGITGLIKTVLALKHRQIPPSLHFQQPNPKIDFTNSPFYMNTELQEWKTPGYPLRAGVSSFGIGGTNAHVVLEEAPLVQSTVISQQLSVRPHQLLLLSAKTESALEKMTDNLVEHLDNHPELDLADVAYTLQAGRKEFDYRRMVVGKELEDIASALKTRESQRVLTHYTQQNKHSIVFMFPGQGSQYANMGQELYETEPVFREWIDRCSELLEPELGLDLRSLIYPHEGELDTANETLKQTQIAQPAIFIIEYALAQLWISWGIKPDAAIGHSIGEYVAATIAGVFSIEDALGLVAMRGRLMQQMPTGSMLAVSLPVAEVTALLSQELSLAAINAPNLCVLSGSDEAIVSKAKELHDRGIECRYLHTSHAFHSPMMDNAIAPLQQELIKINLNSPQIPFISNVTGTWISTEDATDPDYWAKHMRETVRFAAGIDEILQDKARILLEVGAGRSLSTLVKRNSAQAAGQIVLSSIRHPQDQVSDQAFMLNMLGRLWLAGVAIDWHNFSANQQNYRVPLPTYPFERQRYWVDSVVSTSTAQLQDKKANISDWFYIPAWKTLPVIPTNKLTDSSYLIFVDELGIGDRLIEKLRQHGQDTVAVYKGNNFSQDSHSYQINPNNSEDYHTLFQALTQSNDLPAKIIYLWSISPKQVDKSLIPDSQSFWHLIYLAQAIEKPKYNLDIVVATNDFYDIIGDETLSYEAATMLGAIKVIPQEYTYLNCLQVDLDLSESNSELLAEQLITELAIDSPDIVRAYRKHCRWVQTFEPIPIAKNNPEQSRLRQGGVYLITGGMGGIGCTLAEHLACTVQAKLVLLGRSQLPAKESWNEWLATHDANDSISQKISRIEKLEALGAEVLPIAADVCDHTAMKQAVALADDHFGAINGVIHAAGVAGGGIIQLKTSDSGESVLAPKVTGTLILNEVLQEVSLDFLVLCSSLTSIVGGFGQADYCAANAFLDAFARHDRSSRHTVAINWDAWQEVGMAVNTDVPTELKQWQTDNLQHGLLSAEAIKVFDRILDSGLSQVIVSTQNLATAIKQNDNFLEVYSTQKSHSAAVPSANSPARKSLSSSYIAPRNETEETIAKI
ncbi:MAG: type I polyketide synthase [Cyanobacteria bacterium P01_G01_bin.39]